MAAAAPQLTTTTIKTEPLFYGQTPEGEKRQGASAWAYDRYHSQLRRDAAAGANPPNAAANIRKFISGFRAEAEIWWDFTVLGDNSTIDKARAADDLQYVLQLFKEEYFMIQEQEDTASDLQGLKQRPTQSTFAYIKVLQQELSRQTTFSIEHTRTAVQANDPLLCIPNNVRDMLATLTPAQRAGAAHPDHPDITWDAIIQGFAVTANTGKHEGVRVAHQHASFDKVVTHAMETVVNPKMRQFIRKNYRNVGKDLNRLRQLIKEEEKSYKAAIHETISTTMQNNRAPVHAVEEEDEEEPEDEWEVDAFGRRTKKPRGGKRGGRGGARGQGKQQRQPKFQDKAPQGATKWCQCCQSQYHNFLECSRVQRLCRQWQAMGGGQQQPQRGGQRGGGPAGRGGRGGGRGGAQAAGRGGGARRPAHPFHSGDGDEPMDTSAMWPATQPMPQQAAQPAAQAYYYPQQQAAYHQQAHPTYATDSLYTASWPEAGN